MNSLDQPLSEKDEAQQSVTSTQIVDHYSFTFEDSTQAEESVTLPSSEHLQDEPVTPLDNSTWSPLNSSSEATEPFQHEDRTSTISSVSCDEITALHASNHIRESLAKETSHDNQYTNKIDANEEHQASNPLIHLSTSPVGIASDYNIIKERTGDSLAAGSTDQMESLKTTIDVDVSKPAETITRPHPVPAPRTKKPTLSNVNNGPPKVSSVKPTEAEKETVPSSDLAESSRQDDKQLRPSSFRFNIASAKYRSKTSDEKVTKHDEESSGYTQKGQSYNQNLVVQMEKVENTKSTEVCKNTPSVPDKRSSLQREVISQNVSKTGVGDNPEKSEGYSQNTEHLKSENAEESEDKRGLFGVKLRSTSLCLKYRSELPKSEAEMSLEGHQFLAVKEPVSSDVEAVSNDRKANALTNPAPPSLDSQQDPTLEKGIFLHYFRE